jgi:hypothetical protein
MNRRNFIKKTAVTTALVSTAPAVLTQAIQPKPAFSLVLELPSVAYEGDLLQITGWIYENGKKVREIKPSRVLVGGQDVNL